MSSPKRKFTAADLVAGQNYRVIAAFNDYDGINHPADETWRFVEKNLLPYDDGLTLFVERDGKKMPFRFQWRDETQGKLIDNFSDFVEEM